MKLVASLALALGMASQAYGACEIQNANIVVSGVGNFSVTGEYVKVFKVSQPDYNCLSSADDKAKCHQGGDRITENNFATYTNSGSGTTIKIDGIPFDTCNKLANKYEVVKFIGADEVSSTGLGFDAYTVYAGDNFAAL